MEATFQPYAECVDEKCGWGYPESSMAREQAKFHVRSSGHRVRVVIEKVAVWGPKDD